MNAKFGGAPEEIHAILDEVVHAINCLIERQSHNNEVRSAPYGIGFSKIMKFHPSLRVNYHGPYEMTGMKGTWNLKIRIHVNWPKSTYKEFVAFTDGSEFGIYDGVKPNPVVSLHDPNTNILEDAPRLLMESLDRHHERLLDRLHGELRDATKALNDAKRITGSDDLAMKIGGLV